MNKPRIFSGVQPSGNLHIGNYLGAIAQFVELQKNYDSIFCVVDYHAITVPQDPKILRNKIVEIARLYLAAGIDPKKSIIFQQSSVTAHTELGWVLNTIARMSDLKKMTQFKDKSGGEEENVSVGLFDYPVLMAADILLYDTELVPVGDDQLQHVELARDLAKRFNHRFGETFVVPKAKTKKEGARIMGLDDPVKKMSKSAESEYNRIELLDDPEKAKKKIMRATTDSGKEIKYDWENKPGVSNLMTIYALLKNSNPSKVEMEFAGQGYGDFKKAVAEEVAKFLINFQENYNKINEKEVRKILDNGSKKVEKIANETLKRVKEKIGVN